MQTSETLIIGAGAAGMMTAISAALHGAKNITLLNATTRLGLKILMAGGGRCNITNARLDYKKFFGASPNSIKKIIKQFPPTKMIAFLENQGVATKVEEPWDKYFPVSDRAQTVLDALVNKMEELEIDLQYPVKAQDLLWLPENHKWQVQTDKGPYQCHNLVLASGGFSYPHTGSDGKLWSQLKQLGLPLENDYPALTPLRTKDQDFQKLSGMSLWAQVGIKDKEGKYCFREVNSILFTHSGLSGPGILNASQWFTHQGSPKYTLEISLLPEREMGEFEKEFIQLTQQRPNWNVENFLAEFFSKRLAKTLSDRVGITEINIHQVTKKQRKALLKEIFCHTPQISGHFGYKKAEVTGGGIPLTEIDPKTMAVKEFSHLFAVGEIVNVHGVIGGYNFQWAWSSGWVCGKSLAQQSLLAQSQ